MCNYKKNWNLIQNSQAVKKSVAPNGENDDKSKVEAKNFLWQ